MRCTSLDVALATFVPLPFILVTTAYRFWIRYKKQLWGGDDWAMLALLVSHLIEVRMRKEPPYLDLKQMLMSSCRVKKPVWIVNVVGLIGMAWSGVGADDASLSYQQQSQAYFVRRHIKRTHTHTHTKVIFGLVSDTAGSGFTSSRSAGVSRSS